MCPVQSLSLENYYQAWLDTAKCVYHLSVKSVESQERLCDECFSQPAANRDRHQTLAKHYVHIGTPVPLAPCARWCSAPCLRISPIADYGSCIQGLFVFATYIRGLRDETLNSPTILVLEQHSHTVQHPSTGVL